MLRYFSRRAVFGSPVDFIRSITVSTQNYFTRNPVEGNHSGEKESPTEFDTIAEIESNLFDASSHKSKVLPHKVTRNNIKLNKKPEVEPERLRNPQKPKAVSSPTLCDPDLNLSYVKLHLNDPVLSNLILTSRSKKARDKKNRIIVEGRRLILEAIKAGTKLETILFAKKEPLMEIKDDIRQFKDISILRVPQQDLRVWSTLVTCPGVIAIFKKPSVANIAKQTEQRFSFPITVVCDNIREPNNLGSILRTCAAIPCQQVLITKGCCDPWDTKALRGGCGAQFHLTILDDLSWAEVHERIFERMSEDGDKQSLIYLAENNLENCDKFRVDVLPYDEMRVDEFNGHCFLIIGGETHGVSDDAYRLVNESAKKNGRVVGGCLHIPMADCIDSLNTASAVTLLLYEMRRKLTKRLQSPKDNVTNILN